MRPGRADDLPQLFELWRREVSEDVVAVRCWFEVYQKLGFEVMSEAEVWEATFP